jgi:hypothetical protein
MTALEKLYIQGTGIGGQLPSKMPPHVQEVSLYDNKISGKEGALSLLAGRCQFAAAIAILACVLVLAAEVTYTSQL